MKKLMKKTLEEEESFETYFDEQYEDEFEDWFFESQSDDEMDHQNLDSYASKAGVQAYKFVHTSKLEEGEKPFYRVIGHDNQKKELLNVISWFKRSKELKEKGISIPKGGYSFR